MNDDTIDTAAAVRQYLGEQTKVQARAAVSAAAGTSGDLEAELRAASQRTGVPLSSARAMPAEVTRRAKIGEVMDAVQQFPSTLRFLTDDGNARLAHDDTDALTSVESALGAAARYVVSAPDRRNTLMGDIGAGIFGASRGAAGVFQAAAEFAAPVLDPLSDRRLLPANPLRAVAGEFAALGAGAKATGAALSPPQAGLVAGGVSSGVQSLTQNLFTLPLALINPAVALTSMAGLTGGQSYQDAREKGLPMSTALPFAASQAAIEYATEKLPVEQLLGDLAKNATLRQTLMRQLATEIPGEQVATVLQDLNEWAVLNPSKPFSNYLAERPAAALQTLIATVVGTGGNVAVMRTIDSAITTADQRAARADAAAGQAELLKRLVDVAAASKLRERAPDTFEAFVQQASEDGPLQDVFIDAQALMQSGLGEQLAQVAPSVAEQLPAALATGGDVRIPVAEFAARVAGTDLAAPLLDHLRTEPGGMSRAEAEAYMQSHKDELQAEVEAALAEQQTDAARRAAVDEVRAELRRQLDAAGRFTAPVNEAYASMLGSWYEVQAARLGATPQELYSRYPLQVRAHSAAGGPALEQGGPDPSGEADEVTGLPLNKDGTVTVYHHTTAAKAKAIRREGVLRSAGEPDLYFTTTAEPNTGYGDTVIPMRVRPERLVLDDEFPDGRQDFRVGAPGRARRVRFRPDGSGDLQQAARGTFSPSTNTIALLQGADLSTFLHESGHFFLEALMDMAARIEGQQRDGASIAAGEQEILADAEALLRWFGVESLTEWHRLSLDEKRDSHERFARGFEAYLFDGKAPAIELHGLFQRFRAWLLSVYKSLKALNVELSPEVRGVMDRMLASTEQIKLAEQGRSLLPLFATADQAGMTPEEFASYQALGVDATNDAIGELQTKGLRDMQWLHNARGRVLKRLQREAAERRREIRAEVRTEVMGQPIYRAWSFLTGRRAQASEQAQGERAAAVADWQARRDAAAEEARGKAKAAAWADSDEAKREYPSARAKGMAKGQFLARMKRDIDLTVARAVLEFDRANPRPAPLATSSTVEDLDETVHGKFNIAAVDELGLPAEARAALKARGMLARDGLAPDLVAEMFGFSSGDELARTLAATTPPADEIEGLTDQRMLERYGELATPQDIERAADAAVANDTRARMIATEAAALARAIGPREATGRQNAKGRDITQAVVPRAAREWAAQIVARLRVRDIRPGQYSAAETRAARNAERASRAGDLAAAAAEKRNQLVQHYAARAAHEALDDVDAGLRYLRGFDREGTRKSLDVDYLDQIDALLERFDLRQVSNKAIDKRASLVAWVESQREQGLEPDIPPELLNEARRQSYRTLTVEEFRGLVDSVRQIEHLARLKHRLLTARDQRAFEAVRDEIAEGIDAVATAAGRVADTRTPTTNLGRAAQAFRRFWAAHIKVASWARVMDGGRAGPVWEHIVRTANERGDTEATMRAEATQALSRILASVFAQGRMGGKGQWFPTIGRSLNREARIALALNVGNEGNLQRLLGGEGWSLEQVAPVLQSLTADEWLAVQAVWDHFESYRPAIAAKERRVYGKEPAWVEPRPFEVRTASGAVVPLRGGYYPIKYDPAASQRAEEHADAEGAKRQLQGAYTSATTRRSFTKSRVSEVQGRPLLYTLSGLYSGVNDVIHDLQWHEWLIDVNRLLKSGAIDGAMREHYGPEVKAQFKSWVQDIAEGEKGSDAAVDQALSRLRQGISAAGLGFNVVSAAMQPLGMTQSVVRVGAKWVGRGVARYVANPRSLAREVNAKSEFMANRARTRFRELAELRNQVQDQTAAGELMGRYAYWLMMQMQRTVDLPTWWGAYEKALAAGEADDRAVALADQAVIDAQGGGQTKDLAAIERGGPAQRLFTVFYSFMNTALNLGVAQTMTADTPARRAKLAADYLMLFTVPAVLGQLLKDALTPGGGDEDWEALARRLLAAQLDFLMGLMVVVREFAEAAKTITGANDRGRDYTGPAGLRAIADTVQLAKQAHQDEFDDAFRKALINVAGDLTGLPAAQMNRTITGAKALAEGETENPAAVVFGYQQAR